MLAKDVWQYVNHRLAPYAPLELDELRGEGDSISLQAGRGEPELRRYLDGSRSGSFCFELRARARERQRGLDWLEGVADHFAAGAAIPLAGRRMFRVRVVCAPYLMERGPGWFLYGAQFEMEYDEMALSSGGSGNHGVDCVDGVPGMKG